MATKFHGYARKTFKYRDGAKQHDERQYVGVFKRLESNRPAVYDQYGDHAEQRVTFVAPRGVSEQDAVDAIYDASRFGCTCSYDCCGHWQGSASNVTRTKGREFSALVYSYRNV
jgi:hypothetical protein